VKDELLLEGARGEPAGFLPVPGGRVAYWRAGAGPNPPLLCLHGGPGLPHDYLEPLALLGDVREVLFFDQLGCGRSDRPSDCGLWSLDRFKEEVAAVVEGLALGAFHLFGNSWGGWLALECVLGNRVRPVSLILSSCPPSVQRWIAGCDRLRSELPAETRQDLERHERAGNFSCPEFVAAMTAFYRRHLCRLRPWPDALERALAGFGADVYETMWGPSEFGPVTGNLSGWDAFSRLGGITQPALVTGGRYDEAVPGEVEALAAALPNARLEMFESSSHTAFLEEPMRYVDVAQRFLREMEGGPL
jgi:proline-specific peptidase